MQKLAHNSAVAKMFNNQTPVGKHRPQKLQGVMWGL